MIYVLKKSFHMHISDIKSPSLSDVEKIPQNPRPRLCILDTLPSTADFAQLTARKKDITYRDQLLTFERKWSEAVGEVEW